MQIIVLSIHYVTTAYHCMDLVSPVGTNKFVCLKETVLKADNRLFDCMLLIAQN